MNFFTTTDKSQTIKKLEDFFQGEQVGNIENADIVVFPDESREINEGFFGRRPVKGDKTKIMDDAFLTRIYLASVIQYSKPIVGFGSGAHVISMASGAEVYGGASHHLKMHKVFTTVGSANSVGEHLQIMNPYILPKEDYEILAYSVPSHEVKYHLGRDNIIHKAKIVEPEIIHYKYVNALCIQSPLYELGHVTYKNFGQTLVHILVNDHNNMNKFTVKIPKL